jgi:cytochrome P450
MSPTAGVPTVEYDPYSSDMRDNPYPVYQYLRDEAPIYQHPQKGFFVLSRFADVLGVLHDWETYSSAKGITLEGLPPDVQPEMITMDPPRHDDLRSLVKRAFTPRAIGQLEPRVYAVASELVAALDPEEFDLVRDIGGPVPSVVICELLGIPFSDRPLFRGWIEVLIRRKPDEPDTIAAARAASAELSEYLAGQIADRRRQPTDDLIGFAVSVAEDGRTLDDEELLGFVRLLLVAGNETTINSIGNSFLALARHPDQRARLADDPSLTTNAVEEILRFESPVPQLCRHTTRDTKHHGVEVPAGSVVVTVFAAANRDEREFDDPNVFDVTRRVDRHLALGHGIHHCLGAALARLQTRAAIDAVLARFPDYQITTDTIEMLPSGHARGPVSLPATAS